MKKLLSLLSVLTISSSAIPTTIAASYYQKEEKLISEINLQTNNLENLNRSKRSNNLNVLPVICNNNYNLNITPIIQEEDFWCGLSIAEVILRYYGLESLNGSSRQTNYQFQRILSQQMNTINGGTLMNDWIVEMNNIILSNRLNYNRTYSRTEFDLAYNYNNTSNRFYNIVSYSLQYNVPVVFMYHGSRHLNEEDHSHFILITGIRNNYNDVIYTFLDPWTGTMGEFNSSNLNSFLTPTRMYDNQERLLPYGGQLASFTGNITNWDYEKTHTIFNDNDALGGSSLQDLGSIIKNSDLGFLNNKDITNIKYAVKKNNTNLDINDVGVSKITDNSADINGFTSYSDSYNSKKYQGYKKVYFTVKTDIITDFKWCIDPVNDIDNQTILNAVKAKNPNLDISQVYVKEKVIGGRLELGVKSNSNKYNINSSAKCNNFKVSECTFIKIFLTPVWDNWYRLIPFYDFYNMISCVWLLKIWNNFYLL